ncbi:short-chain dehydrogenase [Paenibacillus donghaensis]|uniref:Uncharacterized protein n=1 Tax=Paenibacillus donghaensis TaxID=414771 RepID=A0A2Z2KE09_9BACL|nr:short-chain dehydrogenase [Paenibacillus donghaensis]ASA21293.1 hypothetical protein B9T62_11150 [Paenibacillus donghaensis]
MRPTIGSPPSNHVVLDKNTHNLKFLCSRNINHTLLFFFNTDESVDGEITITKIGQFPSTADIANEATKKYVKVLGRDLSREFNKAIGLVSHGVGIGSFVYLRRIFENLIEEAHSEAKSETDWNEEEYLKARMNEKVGLLKGQLPEFLVQHKSLYSILSKGIHELSEEECLEMFSIVRSGIELILDEKLEKIKKDKKIAEASRSIEALHVKYK